MSYSRTRFVYSSLFGGYQRPTSKSSDIEKNSNKLEEVPSILKRDLTDQVPVPDSYNNAGTDYNVRELRKCIPIPTTAPNGPDLPIFTSEKHLAEREQNSTVTSFPFSSHGSTHSQVSAFPGNQTPFSMADQSLAPSPFTATSFSRRHSPPKSVPPPLHFVSENTEPSTTFGAPLGKSPVDDQCSVDDTPECSNDGSEKPLTILSDIRKKVKRRKASEKQVFAKRINDGIMKEIMKQFRLHDNGEKIVPLHLTEINAALSDEVREHLAMKGGLLRFMKDRRAFFRLKKMQKQGGYYITTHVHIRERFAGNLKRTNKVSIFSSIPGLPDQDVDEEDKSSSAAEKVPFVVDEKIVQARASLRPWEDPTIVQRHPGTSRVERMTPIPNDKANYFSRS